MSTRRGQCYNNPEVMKNLCLENGSSSGVMKRRRVENVAGEEMKVPVEIAGKFAGKHACFDALPDDIVLCILCKLSSTATCPADFIGFLVTCKRLYGLGLNPTVISRASRGMVAVKAKNWSESAHRFLKLCANTGNPEACFTLGMIHFYCLQNREIGASLMAKAARVSHAPALYSLAVIHFNGSGGSKHNKNLRAGVLLCARASVTQVDALREFGHCLQDGYGVARNIPQGRHCLIQANARELALVLAVNPDVVVPRSWLAWNPAHPFGDTSCPLLSDFGCNVPSPPPHPANQFLTEWFADRSPGPGLRLCSHARCGRPETRRHEFRRCSVCGAVNYCSRACQALDWKLRHKLHCAPADGQNGANGHLNREFGYAYPLVDDIDENDNEVEANNV